MLWFIMWIEPSSSGPDIQRQKAPSGLLSSLSQLLPHTMFISVREGGSCGMVKTKVFSTELAKENSLSVVSRWNSMSGFVIKQQLAGADRRDSACSGIHFLTVDVVPLVETKSGTGFSTAAR